MVNPALQGKCHIGLMPERRKRPKVSLLAQVESRAAKDFSLGRVQNISNGGMLVKTPDTYDHRSEVTVRFNLPPNYHIECQGMVMHFQPRVHMGIQFLQLKEEHREAIAEFVQASPEVSVQP